MLWLSGRKKVLHELTNRYTLQAHLISQWFPFAVGPPPLLTCFLGGCVPYFEHALLV